MGFTELDVRTLSNIITAAAAVEAPPQDPDNPFWILQVARPVSKQFCAVVDGLLLGSPSGSGIAIGSPACICACACACA